MNWIRTDRRMKSDPTVHRLAARLTRGDAVAITGHLQWLLSELPDHAPDGNLADVPDGLLEQWAGWRGKPGAFAAAFRAEMCDAAGVVRAWDKHNGRALAKAADDRARLEQQRRERGAKPRTGGDGGAPKPAPSPESRANVARRSPDSRANVAAVSPEVRGSVARNVTERHVTAVRSEEEVPSVSSAPAQRAALRARAPERLAEDPDAIDWRAALAEPAPVPATRRRHPAAGLAPIADALGRLPA